MASLNEIFLIGNLGQDAEMREASTGNRYLSFGIATTKWNKDLKKEEPVWHNIHFWASKENQNSLDKLEPFLTKGKQVFVKASLGYYKNKEGVKMITITASKVELLGSRENNEFNQDTSIGKDTSVFGKPPVRKDDEDDGGELAF
jgi:single stranded DNA-binding protein